MEQESNTYPLLDMIDRPTFFVRDGIVVQANALAQQRLITPGIQVADILRNDYQAYEDFTGGCLYLTVTTAEIPCGTTVTRMDDMDVFSMDQESDFSHMQALALAAQKLAIPLTDVMILADSLQTYSRTRKQAAQIRRALYQLQRIICNMSDLPRYDYRCVSKMETVNIASVFDEIMEKASTAFNHAKHKLDYIGPMVIIMGLADREMLERAVNNLLSNAAKFSPPRTTIKARLTRNGNMLSFTVLDKGTGIENYVQKNLFNRYLREPCVEDGRFGVGLGMALIRAVAANHGGTVLITKQGKQGTKVTMTLSIRQSEENVLRSPVMLPVSDYAGGWNQTLVEFADILSSDAYRLNNES